MFVVLNYIKELSVALVYLRKYWDHLVYLLDLPRGGLGFQTGPDILTTPALARATKSNRRPLRLIQRS